jgi:hypothetical protein
VVHIIVSVAFEPSAIRIEAKLGSHSKQATYFVLLCMSGDNPIDDTNLVSSDPCRLQASFARALTKCPECPHS